MLIKPSPQVRTAPRADSSSTQEAQNDKDSRVNADHPPRAFPQDQVFTPGAFTLSPGEVLFEEGDPSGCAYFIESGLIEVIHINGENVTTVGLAEAGQILGEMGVIDHLPRAATARAKKETSVRMVPAEVLEEIVARGDPAIQALVKTLISRLRDAIA